MNALAACIALAATVAIASTAWAGSDRYSGPRGYKPQTWEDIARDREEIQRLTQQRHKPGSPNSVDFPDFVAHSPH